MTKKKAPKRIKNLAQVTAELLIVLGTPILFFLKILVWAVLWLSKESLRVLRAGGDLLTGVFDTFSWLYKLILRYPYPKIKIIKIARPALPFQRDLTLVLLGFVICFLFIFLPYNAISFLLALPNPKTLSDGQYPVTTKIYDRSGLLLYQIYSQENRTPIALSALPKYVAEATVAIEDKNFYRHLGFDLGGILRATVGNLRGQSLQGGSTITQQLIKSALLTPERTVTRKIKELLLAFWAERIYSKNQILEMYLNQVPYGGATYGIEAAAQTYFNKHATDLNLAEAALLAGLPSAPSAYSPFGSHPEFAKERQREVLASMVERKHLSPEGAATAESAELKFAPQASEIKAPHFVMYVKDLLTEKYGIKVVEQGGLEVTTTLDYAIYQKTVEEIRVGVDRQKALRVGNGAALVTNPKTGEILAMVGSVDYFDKTRDGNVNVTLSRRSPGSAIKPVNYAAAFEKNLISPATVIDDAPITYRIPGQPPYSPGNYDGKFHGKVTIRTALGSSYNVPAVKVLQKLTVREMFDRGRAMGINSWKNLDNYGLALTLGGGEVTMLELATAYGVLANDGVRTDLNPILKVTDFRGKTLENNWQLGNLLVGNLTSRILSPQAAFLTSDILADNGARSPAFGASSALVIPGHTVAVKTGTAETKRDNWTVGYSFGNEPRLVAVWVGNNDNTPMSPYLESGNTGAAAIWSPIMKSLLIDKPDARPVRPGNLIAVEVCTINGLLPCENCPAKRFEYFVPGTQPTQACKIEKKEEENK